MGLTLSKKNKKMARKFKAVFSIKNGFEKANTFGLIFIYLST